MSKVPLHHCPCRKELAESHQSLSLALFFLSLNFLFVPCVSLGLAPHDLDGLRLEPFLLDGACRVVVMVGNARISRSVDRHGLGVPGGAPLA